MGKRALRRDGPRPEDVRPAEDRNALALSAGYGSGLAIWAPSEDGAEFSLNLAEYWRLLMKHRILIAVIFVTALALGAVATLLMTPIYTAQTMVQIDRETAKVVEGADVEPRESMVAGEEFFQTQYGLLRSRSLAVRVIDALGLAKTDRRANANNGLTKDVERKLSIYLGGRGVE